MQLENKVFIQNLKLKKSVVLVFSRAALMFNIIVTMQWIPIVRFIPYIECHSRDFPAVSSFLLIKHP